MTPDPKGGHREATPGERVSISRALLDDLLVVVAHGHLTPAMGDALNRLVEDGRPVTPLDAVRAEHRAADGPLPAYQGHANYPTWAVSLWLGNDEPLYRQAQAIANRTRLGFTVSASELDAETWSVRDALRRVVGEKLSAMVDALPEVRSIRSRASLPSDVLGWGLAFVDWDAVADGFLEDVDA